MSWLRDKINPIFIVNEKLLKFFSLFSVIEIGNITFGPIVFSRTEPSEGSKRHERIHTFQYFELAFFLFFLIYLWDITHAAIKYRNLEFRMQQDDYHIDMTLGQYAYRRIRFEQEAYANHHNPDYFATREWYAWRNYKV